MLIDTLIFKNFFKIPGCFYVNKSIYYPIPNSCHRRDKSPGRIILIRSFLLIATTSTYNMLSQYFLKNNSCEFCNYGLFKKTCFEWSHSLNNYVISMLANIVSSWPMLLILCILKYTVSISHKLNRRRSSVLPCRAGYKVKWMIAGGNWWW